MQVLLFHAERSTAMGKDCDPHSEDQAIEGIYSTRDLAWVRGPAGVSRATWYRVNGELEQTPENPMRRVANSSLRRYREEPATKQG